MKPSLKRTLLASTIVGLAVTAASGAWAQYGGGYDRNNVVTYSRDTGGYCDFAGCPDRFWEFPVHYGPVFFRGQWYQGPVYFRADRHGRQYWVRGGWHRDEWRGRRPNWARQSHDGPPLGLAYYASHGFRISDRSRQSDYGDTGGRVSYRSFHRTLAAHGDWVYSDRWGEVWIPSDVPRGFHPYYTGGHWANTREYGWMWVSDYDWGDIAFHYGRWVNDPDDGWMWIPGYVWSPGWVVWRSNDRYTGWMPMPPDEGFLRGDTGGFSISINFNRTDDYYGYSRWYGRSYDQNRFASNWVFVGTGNLSDRDYRSHAVSGGNVVNIINTTNNVTNYTVVNNYVVNRSVDARAVEQAGGRPVATVSAATVVRTPALITTADTGRAVQVQTRQAQPQGTGTVSSAPQPSAEVVRNLSTRPVERNGRTPAHLFTQTTVVNAPLKPAPAAVAPPAANALTAPVNAPAASGAAPAPGGEKPGGAEHGRPQGAPGGAMTAPTSPAATTPTENNPAGERGGKNRDRQKGGAENQPAPQGTAPTTPAQTPAPAATPPAANNPPADMGRRNRDRNRGGPENQGGAPTPPAQTTAPAATPPAANNPPADMGKRNRDRNRGGPENQGGAQGAAPTAPAQSAPTATTPTENNPPADMGRRNRERNRGGPENQGGAQGAAPTAPAQSAPAAAPAPANNTPADTGRNRERRRGGPNNQEGAPAQTATPPAQTAPVVTPPPANTPADKAKDRRKHKDNQDDNQTNDTNPPQ